MAASITPFEAQEARSAINVLEGARHSLAYIKGTNNQQQAYLRLSIIAGRECGTIGAYCRTLDVDARPLFRWIALVDEIANHNELITDPSVFAKAQEAWPDAAAVLRELRYAVTHAEQTAPVDDPGSPKKELTQPEVNEETAKLIRMDRDYINLALRDIHSGDRAKAKIAEGRWNKCWTGKAFMQRIPGSEKHHFKSRVNPAFGDLQNKYNNGGEL